jgi:hypothetical protein
MTFGPLFVAAIGILLPILVGLWLMPKAAGEPPVPALALRSAHLAVHRMRATLHELGASSVVRHG